MSAEFLIDAIGVFAAVIAAIYGIRTYHLNRRGLGMEKPEPKRRPWWTWGTIAVLVGLVWLVVAIHYFSLTRPNFQAGVGGIFGGPSPTDSDNIVAVINLNVANIGAVQSVATGWHVTVSADGLTYDCTILSVPAKIVIINPKKVAPGLPQSLTITSDQDLSQISDPLQVGDMDSGVIYVEFPTVSTRGAVEFNIAFEDVFGGKYSVSDAIDGAQLQLGVKIPAAGAQPTTMPPSSPAAPK